MMLRRCRNFTALLYNMCHSGHYKVAFVFCTVQNIWHDMAFFYFHGALLQRLCRICMVPFGSILGAGMWGFHAGAWTLAQALCVACDQAREASARSLQTTSTGCGCRLHPSSASAQTIHQHRSPACTSGPRHPFTNVLHDLSLLWEGLTSVRHSVVGC